MAVFVCLAQFPHPLVLFHHVAKKSKPLSLQGEELEFKKVLKNGKMSGYIYAKNSHDKQGTL